MKLTKILAATLVIGVSALATASYAAEKGKVGIAMPTQSSSRWISDGHSMVEQFKAAGFETDRQREILVEQGCEFGQGYLLGMPLPLQRTHQGGRRRVSRPH